MATILLWLLIFVFIITIFILGWQEGIKIKHKESGVQSTCYVGFSWTYLLFGFFVPIFRGEIIIGIVHAVFSFITLGLFWLIMTFLYNKQHAVRLLTNSWILNDSEKMNQLACEKIGIKYDNDSARDL